MRACTSAASAFASAMRKGWASMRNSTSPAFTCWPSRTCTDSTMPETSVVTLSCAAFT